MDAKAQIGQFVRTLRAQADLTQEQLAAKTGITYQYLSGLENGHENFSIEVLASLAEALKCPLPQLVSGAFFPERKPPVVDHSFFRQQVPLPPGLKTSHLEAALNATQRMVALINANLLASRGKPLAEYIQGNNFSGLISNILCDALHDNSPFKHNSDQAYPDLINPSATVEGKPTGLEIKSTVQIGKGGESHNGHSGWHCIACFKIDQHTGNVHFVHIMFAILNSHSQKNPDWTYVGSKVNKDTGSRRTETYNTTLVGTTKLRDGSVFLDSESVNFSRWRQKRHGSKPVYSIFV